MKRLVLVAVVVGFACQFTGAAFGDIIQVPTQYPTIQAGIDAASSGDTVEVAPGTYYENITMKSDVVIQGAGAGDDPSIHSIIDGGGTGTVVTAITVDSAAKLDGFKITHGGGGQGGGMYNDESSPTVSNCIFSGNSSGDGGGMKNFRSSPTVTNCTFSGNSATSDGGGMYNDESSPTVTNCTFSGNSASDLSGEGEEGGGMYNDESSPTVTNCTFSGNSADSAGGGMYNYDSSPTVSNCTFSGNSSQDGGGMYNYSFTSPTVTNCAFSGNLAYYGGGMYNDDSSPTVSNCTFSGNSAFYGGGMYNNDSSPTVINCTLSGNTAYLEGGGMHNDLGCSPTVTNCILWGDTPQEIHNAQSSTPVVSYSDIQGGYAGTGIINADPMFLDPDGPDNIPGNQDDDFHLKPNSPCIDAGDNSAPALPATDLDGNDRRIDDPTVADTGNGAHPIVDMGADEYQPVRPEGMFYIMPNKQGGAAVIYLE